MLDRLKENPKNPRTLNKAAFEKLKNKVKSFPEMLEKRPIVYDEDFIVLGGNQRLRVLKELVKEGFEVKDSYFMSAEGWSEEQKRQFVITDNVSDGEWDYEILGNEWDDLPLNDWGIDGISWDTDDVIEDEAPEVSVEPPVSKLGEIYQLGRHRIMCGDSTKIEDVEKLMNGQKADMVFTDPPYGVDYSGGIQFTKEGVKKNQRDRLIDDHNDTDIYSRVVPIIPQFTNGAVYMWFADTQALPVYQAVQQVGDIHALIIWVKNGGYSAMNANYKQKHEPCLYWKPKGGKLNFTGASTETTVWELNKDGVNEYHPTQKPIALCAKAIKNHDSKTVLDLFGGSGSTLIACEQTDRTCYGMELDPKYCDVIRKRYHKFVTDSEEGWEEATPVIK